MSGTWPAVTIKLIITDPLGDRFDGFIILTYEDKNSDRLHRIDISASKVGSSFRGLMGTLDSALNNAIQAGDESFRSLVQEMLSQTYSPKGETNDPEIPTCTSLANYIAQRIIKGAPKA